MIEIGDRKYTSKYGNKETWNVQGHLNQFRKDYTL